MILFFRPSTSLLLLPKPDVGCGWRKEKFARLLLFRSHGYDLFLSRASGGGGDTLT
jgi:hypothetical protein